MPTSYLSFLESAETFFWEYGGVPTLMVVGIYFTIISGCFQLIKFPTILKNFYNSMYDTSTDERGVKPLYIFFASIGGCIGIGNVIGVCTAVNIGGPGAVFWMWVAAFFGMLVKYSEIYLGMVYRVADGKKGYIGGPIVYLQQLSGGRWLANAVAFLLCIYGIEIYMFKVITHTMVVGWHLDASLVIFLLIFMVVFIGEGGINVVGKLSTIIFPIFLVGFILMSLYVFCLNISVIPAIFSNIFMSAFTPTAAVGAFAGASVMMAMSHGVRRACYTGDLGIGYASMIHCQSSQTNPVKEASSAIVAIFLDTFIICTFSLMLILLTGTWNCGLHESVMVSTALGLYFPFVPVLWPFFIFLLGYTSLTSFYAVGKNSASFLWGSYANTIYPVVAVSMFFVFSYYADISDAMMIMSIAGALLLMINLYGIIRLSDRIKFI